MGVQSIWAMIEPGDPAGDRFLHTASQMPVREVDRIAEAHDLAEKIWTVTEALENARDVLTS